VLVTAVHTCRLHILNSGTRYRTAPPADTERSCMLQCSVPLVLYVIRCVNRYTDDVINRTPSVFTLSEVLMTPGQKPEKRPSDVFTAQSDRLVNGAVTLISRGSAPRRRNCGSYKADPLLVVLLSCGRPVGHGTHHM
jgi:hypothetical protein